MWCWRRLLRVLWTARRSNQIHPKRDQSWIFIGRTDNEAETPILWPPDVKKWLLGKHPDAGKDWRQEEKGMTEDEMVGWHHQLNGHVLSKLQELVIDREAWHAAVCGVSKSQTRMSDWTELNPSPAPPAATVQVNILKWFSFFLRHVQSHPRDFPGGPVIKKPPFSSGDMVRTLVGELRCHVLQSK